MSIAVIIPARYASSRLPGKPLLAETGQPLVQHVVDSARKSRMVDLIVVATDDERILQAMRDFNCQAVMTRGDHASGTDRLAEATGLLHLADDDIVVNIQGDEPEIPSYLIETVINLLKTSGCAIATLCTPLPAGEADDPNKVKVSFNRQGRAVSFSRAKTPHERQGSPDGVDTGMFYLHIGIYAYNVETLKRFTSLAPTENEKAERLEQLRALDNGWDIAVQVVRYDGNGIDTPEDYAAFVERMAQ